MVSAVATTLHNWHHDDPEEAKHEILEAIGDISKDFEVFGDDVVVAPYVRPTKTRGGIITPGDASREDIWQSKVGLIVKVGPEAFPERMLPRWNGRAPAVGDWVYHDVKAAFQAHMKGAGAKKAPTRTWEGWPVRLVRADDIGGRLTYPQWIV